MGEKNQLSVRVEVTNVKRLTMKELEQRDSHRGKEISFASECFSVIYHKRCFFQLVYMSKTFYFSISVPYLDEHRYSQDRASGISCYKS